MKKNLIALSCFAFVGTAISAPEDHDSNSDGRLDRLEFARFQAKLRKPALEDVDADGDSLVSESELLAWAEKYSWDAGFGDGVTSVPFEAATSAVPPPEPESWAVEPLRLRKSHEGLAKPITDAEPASFGYFHNNLNSEETWAVEGTLGAVFEIFDPNNPTEIGSYVSDPLQFVPSVTINRITGAGDGTLSDTDSMVFRGGIAWGLQGASSASFWDYQLIHANFRSSGKTSGNNFATGFELEWEPMRSRNDELISIGGAFRPLGFFDYRIVANGRLEVAESVLGAPGDHLAKIGPEVGFFLRPHFVDRLEFFAQYSYLWELNDGSPNFDYFETGGRIALDDLKQVFLEMKYRYGQLTADYSDIDLLQAALSIKF